MPSSNGGRGGYKNKKDNNTNSKDAAMIENLRGACPPHKKKDLDKLFKQMHGDETKIMEKIQEWWEEPAPTRVEESWESVNKKVPKRKPAGDRRDRGRGGGRDSGGRGGSRGGARGGRGGGRERNGKREDRGRRNHKSTDAGGQASTTSAAKNEPAAAPAAPPVGVPTPVNAPVLKGAWGARAAASVAPTESISAAKVAEESVTATAASDVAEQAIPAAAPAAPKSAAPEANPLSPDLSTSVQPPPGLPSATTAPAVPAPLAAPRASGNVWATKGSAHLIQAEKEPVPVPVPASAPPAPVVEEPEIVAPPSPTPVEQPPTDTAPASPVPTLETGIPAWGSQPASAPEPAPEPASAPTPIEMPIPTPPAPPVPEPEPIVEKVVQEAVVAPVSVQQPPPPASPAAQKVLNMGRWDTGGGDDTDNIDFGFGSFGAVASSDTKTNDIVQVVNKEPPTLSTTTATTGTSVSPARPPPGLSIGGMPPMPASAVMVHELENKLEGASLNAKKTTAPEPGPAPGTQAPPPMTAMGQNALPTGLTQQNYNQQQLHQQVMPGMYNYNSGGFVGGMQPVLAGMPQQQPGKPHGAGIGGHSQSGPQVSLPQQGLYGNQAPQNIPSSAAGNTSRADSSTTDNTSATTGAAPTAGVPPGMPSTIPYANPALHYGAQHAAAAQHQFYAMGGHQQQGIGYNYGYAGHAQQFGGAVQGGFGYPQVMGQSGGYGASHYDDQGHQGTSHHSASGGYQNKSGGGGGGYRGRNAHSNNQYQNQYNPQHGGYGGQPYGMGYHGHAQGGMNDPYAAMQQHQQHGGIHSGGVGGFQDDDHQKGRKGRGGNNSTLQQFQPQGGPPQLGGQVQSFGLQGQQQQQVGGIDTAPSSGGWSNQGAGGWSGSAAQSGGWQGS